jgi:hypothetical protein
LGGACISLVVLTLFFHPIFSRLIAFDHSKPNDLNTGAANEAVIAT